jgi:Na+/H+ antiporter NhaD/arsenite permease-like protein
MFAFPKLIVVILVIAAVWVSYRWLNGVNRELPRRRSASPRPAIHAEDLVACGVCGAYVASSAPGCGRPDCPRPR